VDTDKGKGR